MQRYKNLFIETKKRPTEVGLNVVYYLRNPANSSLSVKNVLGLGRTSL